MIEVKGEYNTALIYTDNVDENALKDIKAVCDFELFKKSKIRIMPDVHAGLGCTIGTTMTIVDKIVPNFVGVDIGCGMEVSKLSNKEIDFVALDRWIRKKIPSGRSIRSSHHEYEGLIDLTKLNCKNHVSIDRARYSIGTLGGGNHFIEVDKDEEGNLYLVVHSGSRHLGTQVADYYQKEAYRRIKDKAEVNIKNQIRKLRQSGASDAEILAAKDDLERNIPKKDFAYVEDDLMKEYLFDMHLTQQFATINRKAMVDVIVQGLGLDVVEQFTTIHNYVDTDEMMLRKGAVSAKKGEKLLIPINMRDGCLICIGKGNKDWNQSAPHGAGRVLSRRRAMDSLCMQEYRASMEGIYTTSISKATLDEAPSAYKPIEEIMENIGDTVEIIKVIKPLYNYKSAE